MITYPIKNNTKVNSSGTQGELAVELKGVSKEYSYNLGSLWALSGVSFGVVRGEILGVIGRNGAGKTTLLNIIGGGVSVSSGTISSQGRILGLFSLGVGFQDELTGKENIFLNGTLLGAAKKEITAKLTDIMEFSELGNFINMPLGTYSQGMRLRLAFSIIANLDFDILLMDEVLAVGDVVFQSKCFQRLMDFKRVGKTLVITTQNIDLIERLCDKTVLLDHGRILFYGKTLEGINKYRALLNTEKFFVGPINKSVVLVEETKKWADDVSEWGKKIGTKEAIIDSVQLITKFGIQSKRIRSLDPLKIKVNFTIKNRIKELHFGIALFRDDGVYCYGPNTAFDGNMICELKEGRGFFVLSFNRLLLAPGEYRLSAAIWDKNETLAFDYHSGCYKFSVIGYCNKAKELLNIPFKSYSGNSLLFSLRNECSFSLDILGDRWGKMTEADIIAVQSVKLCNKLNEEKEVIFTNEYVKLIITFSKLLINNADYYLWVGFYRDDGVCCQSIKQPLRRNKSFKIIFSKLPLLPGSYRISLGVWDMALKKFIMCHHGVYPFRMVFNRNDHGTVYLEHQWFWRLP